MYKSQCNKLKENMVHVSQKIDFLYNIIQPSHHNHDEHKLHHHLYYN